MNKLLKNSSIYALGDIVPRLFTLISFPVLTTYLLPAEYAIINYVNSMNTFFFIVGFLCLNTYYLVYYFRVGDEIEKKKLFGNLSIFIVIINIVLTIILILMGDKLMNYLSSNINFHPYIMIGIITNFFNILTVLPSALYRVQERPLPLTILNIIKGLLIFSLTLILVVFFDFKALGVLYSNLIVSIIFGIIFLIISFRNMIWNINFKQLKKALQFSLPLLPGSLSYYLVSLSDRMLIDKYLSLNELGIYGTAASLALVLNIVSLGAYKAYEPYFFKIYGTDSFLSEFKKVRDYYFFFLIMTACIIAFFSKEFFTFLSKPEFHKAAEFTPIILIGIIFSSLTTLYATIITARNKTKINSAIIIVCGIISVSINMLFLSIFGLLAACLSSIITFGVGLVASMYFSKVRVSNQKIILSFLLSLLISYICIYIIKTDSIIISILYKVISIFILGFIVSKILNLDFIAQVKFKLLKKFHQ